VTPGKVGRFILGYLFLATFSVAALARADHVKPGSVTLTWTAPGDDGWEGRATLYDLRYSNLPIDEFNFGKSLRLASVPAPIKGGATQRFTVDGLDSDTEHYFAIKARDDAGNWSRISNVVRVPVGFALSKGPPTKLIFLPPNPNPARDETHFSLELPVAEEVVIEAFDTQGRRVATVARGMFRAGVAEVTWDLCDDAGRSLPSGVYLLRGLFGGSQVIMRRVAVVR